MSREANKHSAVQCKEKADAFFSKGAYAQALKWYDKSLRLYPLDGVQARRDSAFVCAQTSSARSKSSGAGPGSGSGSGSGSRTGAGASAAPGSTGPRRRAARATPRTASSTARSATSTPRPSTPSSTSSGGGSKRPYKPEQQTLAAGILKCKTHYDVLSVPKNATSSQIRKAYKKLALKLHPDKNAAPSAAEAFQRVGTAYNCLSDEDQRAHYDRFGDEQPAQVPNHAHHGGMHGQPTAEDIFNMMFGGGMRSGVRVHHFGGGGFRRRQPRGRQREAEQSGMAQLLQVLPLLVLFALTMFSFGDSRQPLFSLEQKDLYSVKRMTSHPAVIANLQYYVKPDFGTRTGRELYKVEAAVEQQTYTKLRRECQQSKQRQRQFVSLAKRSSGDRAQRYLQQARTIKMKACDHLNDFRGRYFY